MDWNQILLTGLLTLDELGFLTFTDPDPDKCKLGTEAIWRSALGDLNSQELHAAFDWAQKNWTNAYNRKISPGDLRGFLNKHTALNHGQMFDEVMANAYRAAYGEFSRKTGQVEKYQFNPLISAAIKQMGGLSVFLTIEESELNTFRAQFRDVVNAINEKEAQKHIIKPVLDSRAAIEAQAKPVMMLEQKKPEPEQAQDPRVQESFAALRAKFEARMMADATAKEQAVKIASMHMLEALEALSDD